MFAGMGHWMISGLPPRPRGFDSSCPHHLLLPSSSAQDARPSSGATRVGIPQAVPGMYEGRAGSLGGNEDMVVATKDEEDELILQAVRWGMDYSEQMAQAGGILDLPDEVVVSMVRNGLRVVCDARVR